MAEFKYNEKDVMIPLVDDFITRMDTAQRIIYLNLPEGLIDL